MVKHKLLKSRKNMSATNEARKKVEAAQLRRYLLCADLRTLIFDNAIMPIDGENGILTTDFMPDALRSMKRTGQDPRISTNAPV